jgi:hypothetical protein
MSSNPNPLIFDVETIADVTEDNRAAIASFAKGREMEPEEYATFCPPLARVVCIAWLDVTSNTLGALYDSCLPGSVGTVSMNADDGSAVPLQFECTGCPGEPELLRAFGNLVSKHFQKPQALLVTYSGRNFDLPVLIHRSVKHGVSEGRSIFNKAVREHRFNPQKHVDLLDAVTFFGASSRWPMAAYAIGYGHRSPKDDMDGSQVGGAVAGGRILDVARYCAGDVIATAQIYRRLADAGLIG